MEIEIVDYDETLASLLETNYTFPKRNEIEDGIGKMDDGGEK